MPSLKGGLDRSNMSGVPVPERRSLLDESKAKDNSKLAEEAKGEKLSEYRASEFSEDDVNID